MIVIGLTGALATGKSTVSKLLSSPPHNIPIIDADIIARGVVEPGTYGYRRVVEHFGPSTPDLLLPNITTTSDNDDGGGGGDVRRGRPINRAALGRRVFGSSASRVRDRKVLNGIIHPLVRRAMLRGILTHYVRGAWAVVLDVPLLYEGGLDVLCSVVLMVGVSSADVQMARLRARDKALTEQEARDRVGSQMGVEEKIERTKWRAREPGEAKQDGRLGKVILNDGTREDLQRDVDRVIGEIKGESCGEAWRWWAWQSPHGALLLCLWRVYCNWRARRRWMEFHLKEKANL